MSAVSRSAGLAVLAVSRSAGLAVSRSGSSSGIRRYDVWRRSGLSVAVLLFSKRGGGSRPPGQGGSEEGIPIQ